MNIYLVDYSAKKGNMVNSSASIVTAVDKDHAVGIGVARAKERYNESEGYHYWQAIADIVPIGELKEIIEYVELCNKVEE